MKVSEAIARAIASECPDTPIFSLIGDGNLQVAGSLDRDAGMCQVMVRHEGAAVAMAEGYAHASGRLGLASVTTGPGLTHAATSLLAASRSRVPMVVLTGGVPQERPVGLQAMQALDQRRFAESTESLFEGLRTVAGLADDIRSAFYRARVHRRPVVLEMPLDLQDEAVPDGWEYLPSAGFLPRQCPLPLAEEAVRRLADLLSGARRPILLAGRGAVAAKAPLERLAEQVGALVATTLPAKGLFDGNPWSLGVVGGYSSLAARELIPTADVVVAFGAELGHFTTQAGSLLSGRTVARIDLTPGDGPPPVGKAEVYQADATAAAEALCRQLGDRLVGRTRVTGFRTAVVATTLAQAEKVGLTSDGMVHPGELMRTLGPLLPRDTAVVVGGGHFTSFPCLYLDRPAHGKMILPFGAAAVGQALPVGVGAALADRNRSVVVIEGDGSMMMNIQELETVARLGLDLTVIVMNDSALTAERVRLAASGYSPDLVTYPSPPFAEVARAFGWHAATIDSLDDFEAAFASGRAGPSPTLLDIRISREVLVDPVAVLDLSRA